MPSRLPPATDSGTWFGQESVARWGPTTEATLHRSGSVTPRSPLPGRRVPDKKRERTSLLKRVAATEPPQGGVPERPFPSGDTNPASNPKRRPAPEKRPSVGRGALAGRGDRRDNPRGVLRPF